MYGIREPSLIKHELNSNQCLGSICKWHSIQMQLCYSKAILDWETAFCLLAYQEAKLFPKKAQ